ncbi:hypothetical protein ADUPG1_004467, partial [Aduncisulcus paluster]
ASKDSFEERGKYVGGVRGGNKGKKLKRCSGTLSTSSEKVGCVLINMFRVNEGISLASSTYRVS